MEIKNIKTKLTIAEVLAHYHLCPDRNHRLNCPWHDDKTPSLQIFPKTNTWTCFSSNCTAGSGDVIDFIMKYKKITKYEALLKATELITGNTTKNNTSINTIKSEMEAKPETNQLSRQAVLAKYFQSSLNSITKSKAARNYAADRNLDHKLLSIGFCSNGIAKQWNAQMKESAEQLGLLKIKNCLIFPIKNKQGHVISIYGRSIAKNNSSSKHFYLSGGFKGLYPSWPAAQTKKLILTESIIDAATMEAHGGDKNETSVLALYGTNGWTAEHSEAVSQLVELEEVIMFFDGDEAGVKAVEKYTKKLQELRPGIKISNVETPEGEDPNSLLESHDAEIFTHLIENRKVLEAVREAAPEPKNENFIFSTEKQLNGTNPGLTPDCSPKLITSNPELILYETSQLHITILGGIKITGLDRMRVTLKITSKEKNHLPLRHSLDLYYSKQVEQLTQKMSEILEISNTSAQKKISDLTGELEIYREQKLEELKPKKKERKTMSQSEYDQAMKFLKDPKLLRNTLEDIGRAGIVGETNNSLIAYLVYTSRKQNKPLHIICLGPSGTGKTYLQENASQFIPGEEKIEITSLSDNAFYYFGREELMHKLILIEDLDGAENVLYPLRELQSKRRITKTVTLKDNKGNLKTVTLIVEGPVCVSGCTTREKLYEDNANRCILLYIDNSEAQDKRIMAYQQRVAAGKVNSKEQQDIKEKIKNAQRLLKKIKVVNPYAEMIDLPDVVFKPRRTLLLLLSFIETITFYHQYQRSVRTDSQTGEKYIQSTYEDIEAGFSLMKEVLFSKSDELCKASRIFFEQLKGEVKPGSIFYAKAIRKKFRLAPSTLKRYLVDLTRYGYLKIKGGSKYTGFEYMVCDYDEYDNLTSSIDQKLAEIMTKIEVFRSGNGGPVAHQWPTKVSEPLKVQEIIDLDKVAH